MKEDNKIFCINIQILGILFLERFLNGTEWRMEMKKLIRMGAAFLLFCLLLGGAYQYRSGRMQEDVAEKILRFHVIANSNAKEDQALKLKVRDEIGAYLGTLVAKAEDLQACEAIVEENLERITACAGKTIAKEGYAYPVQAAIRDVDFPEKTYGSYTFPKGRYRALKVVIGDGAGENWWCVMYPNLCFAGSVYGAPDETAKEALRATLSEETYEEMVAEGNLHVKFKYLEKLLSLFGE